MPFSPRAKWMVSLLCGVLAGCGEPAPHFDGVQRVELSAAAGALVEHAVPTVEAHLRVPADLDPWTFEGARYRLVAGPESGTEISVKERGETKLVIPGSFDTASIDQVALTLKTRRTLFVHARLYRGERSVLRSLGTIAATNRPGLQVVRMNFATNRPDKPCDRLEIVVQSSHGSYNLIGVDLVSIPPASRMPQLRDGPELLSIGSDLRMGLGLSSRTPLVGRFRVPPDGALAFSYGLPAALGQDQREIALELSLDGVERRYPLVSASYQDEGWSDDRIDLSEHAGREVEVEFSVRAEDGEVAFCALGTPHLFSVQESPPTVFLITSDTHRFDHLGSSRRGVDVRTPNLDALADSGITFENCFSATNVTLPSHIALLTGTSLRDTGVFDNKIAISRDAGTVAELFREAGFRTFAVVSAGHLSDRYSGLGQGFDRMRAPRGAACDGEVSVGHLEQWMAAAEGQPLFAWLHVFDAHTPYIPPEDLAALHYPRDKDPNDPSLPEPEFKPPPGVPPVRDVEHPRAMYRAEVSYVDRELARLFAFERLREGIVAFTADHGEDLGRHGVWWSHAGLYPDTIHVPLILRWPGGPQGVREVRPVHHLDVARTLLDLAGLADATFPGRSLVDDPRPADEPRFAISSSQLDAAVTVGSLHLILTLEEHNRSTQPNSEAIALHAVELYDLERDPHCELDLSREQRETAARLRALLIGWMLDARPTGWASNEGSMDEETLRELAALGYAMDSGSGGETELFDPECSCENCLEYRREKP